MIKQGDISTANYLLNKNYIANVTIKDNTIIDSENVLPLKGSYKVLINNKQYMLTDNHINYKNGCVYISFI